MESQSIDDRGAMFAATRSTCYCWLHGLAATEGGKTRMPSRLVPSLKWLDASSYSCLDLVLLWAAFL